MQIPITRPWFDEADFDVIRRPLETGWVVQGPYVEKFEQAFAAYAGVAAAVAVSSCTTALHLALAALDIGPGDEVIVPSLTWVASANAVVYCGATPILVDIDLATYNIDPAAAEAAITPRTRAIIPVHLFGLAADMAPLLALAEAHGLAIVEDAACGLGSRWKGRHVGTLGDFGAFSFHPRKAVTTGEGGMLLGRERGRLERVRVLRDHGAGRTDHARHAATDGFLLGPFSELGYNYRMTDIQGALGTTQMEKVPTVLHRRRARAARYDEMLARFDWLRTPTVPAGFEHSYQSYVCLFAPDTPSLAALPKLNAARDRLMRFASDKGVATRQGTHAVHALDYYARRFGYVREGLPRALIAEALSITLPLYPQMTDAEQDYVIEVLATGFEREGR